jgi:hypothetical protein
VSDGELAKLIATGKVASDTLVWNQTMPDWKPAGTTALFTSPTRSSPTVALPANHHVCIITGKARHVSQMLMTEHGWVSAEGKDAYYQSIREGAPIPVADGQSNARADGNRIVIPISGGKLPQRCVKTNRPVTEDRVRNRPLYWCTPSIYFALLINLLVVIILYYALRKKVMLDVPLSREGQSLVTKHKLIAWGAFIVGLITMFWGFAFIADNAIALFGAFAGIGLLLSGLIYGAKKAVSLRVVKLEGDNAWLVGAHNDYIASLPRYP